MQAVIQYIERELSGLYPREEIGGFTRLILEQTFNMDYTGLLINRDKVLNSAERKKIEGIVGRLKTFEPVQYILGETEFYGLRLKVAPPVLIPRPETEELVQWIIKTTPLKSPAILDIGTGSGCIALALKKELPEAKVTGTDISEEALKIARGNAKTNRLDIQFFKGDILNREDYPWEEYDIIVSNPPYIRELEKEKMQPNVLNFEPGTALFVSDSDPLIFYRRIGEFALTHLRKSGFLFFEINECMGNEMKKLMSGPGFKNIQIKKDIRGKDRMLLCQL